MPKFITRIVACLLIPCLALSSVAGLAAYPATTLSRTLADFVAERPGVADLATQTRLSLMINTQSLTVAPICAFRMPHDHRAAALSRRTARLIYTLPAIGMAWLALHQLQAPLPGHVSLYYYMPVYLLIRTILSEVWEQRFENPVATSFGSKVPKIRQRLIIGTILVSAAAAATTVFCPKFSTQILLGSVVNHHQLWALVLATFAMSVAIRAGYLWHRARFWQEWAIISIARMNQVLYVAAVFEAAIAVAAGIAHFWLANDSFYDLHCFERNLAASIVFVGLRWLWSHALEQVPKSSPAKPPAPAASPGGSGRTGVSVSPVSQPLETGSDAERSVPAPLEKRGPGAAPPGFLFDGSPLTVTFKDGESPALAATFKCDHLGQLSRLTLHWKHNPQEIRDQIVQIENNQILHLSYRSGMPYVWLENGAETPWVFSGYDLEETSAQGTQRSYVTVSRYISDDGRITPASESFDHEEMLVFLRALRLGREVTVINHDHHPDDAALDPSRKRVESPGNWCRLAKENNLAAEILWESSDSDVTPSPDQIVKQIPDPNDLRPAYPRVVSTFDADHFSWGLSPRSESEILAKVRRLVAIYREIDRTQRLRPMAVNFTRSSRSRRGYVSFSPESQNTFILNALVSEHQRLLGRVELRKVPGASLESGSIIRQELPQVQTSLVTLANEGNGAKQPAAAGLPSSSGSPVLDLGKKGASAPAAAPTSRPETLVAMVKGSQPAQAVEKALREIDTAWKAIRKGTESKRKLRRQIAEETAKVQNAVVSGAAEDDTRFIEGIITAVRKTLEYFTLPRDLEKFIAALRREPAVNEAIQEAKRRIVREHAWVLDTVAVALVMAGEKALEEITLWRPLRDEEMPLLEELIDDMFTSVAEHHHQVIFPHKEPKREWDDRGRQLEKFAARAAQEPARALNQRGMNEGRLVAMAKGGSRPAPPPWGEPRPKGGPPAEPGDHASLGARSSSSEKQEGGPPAEPAAPLPLAPKGVSPATQGADASQAAARLQEQRAEVAKEIQQLFVNYPEILPVQPTIKDHVEGFDLEGFSSLSPKDVPGPPMKEVDVLHHPQLGNVWVVRSGKFVWVRVESGKDAYIFSPRHGICTACTIRAIDPEGCVWIGHAHLRPDITHDQFGKKGRTFAQMLRVLQHVKNKKYPQVEVQLDVNTESLYGIPPVPELEETIGDFGFIVLPTRWHSQKDLLDVLVRQDHVTMLHDPSEIPMQAPEVIPWPPLPRASQLNLQKEVLPLPSFTGDKATAKDAANSAEPGDRASLGARSSSSEKQEGGPSALAQGAKTRLSPMGVSYMTGLSDDLLAPYHLPPELLTALYGHWQGIRYFILDDRAFEILPFDVFLRSPANFLGFTLPLAAANSIHEQFVLHQQTIHRALGITEAIPDLPALYLRRRPSIVEIAHELTHAARPYSIKDSQRLLPSATDPQGNEARLNAMFILRYLDRRASFVDYFSSVNPAFGYPGAVGLIRNLLLWAFQPPTYRTRLWLWELADKLCQGTREILLDHISPANARRLSRLESFLARRAALARYALDNAHKFSRCLLDYRLWRALQRYCPDRIDPATVGEIKQRILKEIEDRHKPRGPEGKVRTDGTGSEPNSAPDRHSPTTLLRAAAPRNGFFFKRVSLALTAAVAVLTLGLNAMAGALDPTAVPAASYREAAFPTWLKVLVGTLIAYGLFHLVLKRAAPSAPSAQRNRGNPWVKIEQILDVHVRQLSLRERALSEELPNKDFIDLAHMLIGLVDLFQIRPPPLEQLPIKLTWLGNWTEDKGRRVPWDVLPEKIETEIEIWVQNRPDLIDKFLRIFAGCPLWKPPTGGGDDSQSGPTTGGSSSPGSVRWRWEGILHCSA
jgi:hypothetical protein